MKLIINIVAICLSFLAVIIVKRNTAATQAKAFIDEDEHTYTYCIEPCACGVGVTNLAELMNTTYKYPVLKLDLGGNWCDFEIKASTNNFESMVYYYVSSQTNSYGADDPDPFTFYLDDYNNDVRVWFNATPHVPILSQLIDSTSEVEHVYFMPSRTCGIDADTWMWQNNTNLIWSWVRFDGIDFEMNATETKQHWNPIRPERWEINRTKP